MPVEEPSTASNADISWCEQSVARLRNHLNSGGHLIVTFRFPSLDKGAWSPEGDYLPEGDRLLMFKREVNRAEWSAV